MEMKAVRVGVGLEYVEPVASWLVFDRPLGIPKTGLAKPFVELWDYLNCDENGYHFMQPQCFEIVNNDGASIEVYTTIGAGEGLILA